MIKRAYCFGDKKKKTDFQQLLLGVLVDKQGLVMSKQSLIDSDNQLLFWNLKCSEDSCSPDLLALNVVTLLSADFV